MDIFIKGNAPPPSNPNPKELWIDHETGLIHRPNNAPIALSGPTTGAEYEALKAKEAKAKQMMLRIKRDMLSTWQCSQCRWVGSGKLCRIRRVKIHGLETEILVCPNGRCDAPVLRIEDALSLTKVPGVKR